MDLFRMYHRSMSNRGAVSIKFPDVDVNAFDDAILEFSKVGPILEPGDAVIGEYRGKPVIAIRTHKSYIIISETLDTKQWRVYSEHGAADFLTKAIAEDGSFLVGEEMLRFMLGRHTNLENNFVVRVIGPHSAVITPW